MPDDRTTKLAKDLEAWAAEVLPELQTYPDDPASIDKLFPVVVSDVKNERVRAGKEGRFQQYEQTLLRLWDVELWLFVDPEPSWEAQQTLYRFVDELGLAIRRNGTLGGRIEMASPEYVASYEPSEVEYPDGTVARAATFRITVGEQVEV